MHFEIIVEDQSGKIVLETILKKILEPNGEEHSYRIISYKGIGHIPKNLQRTQDPRKRLLLNRLPKLLRGYGKSLQQMSASVIVVVDLDDKDCKQFKNELIGILDSCAPKPKTLFRIAIEEGESWMLGDRDAVKTAYPDAKDRILENYEQDSICGTWERLADAIYPGGSNKLQESGWPQIGQIKCIWAQKISPYMNVDKNSSKSFQVFRDSIRNLAGMC